MTQEYMVCAVLACVDWLDGCVNGTGCEWDTKCMVCTRMRVCMRMCTRMRVYACAYSVHARRVRACMHACMYICMHVCMHMRMRVCVHVRMRVRMRVRMCVRMHVCTYAHLSSRPFPSTAVSHSARSAVLVTSTPLRSICAANDASGSVPPACRVKRVGDSGRDGAEGAMWWAGWGGARDVAHCGNARV